MRVLPLFIAVALSASLAACSGGPATTGDGNAGDGGDTGTSDGGGGGTDDSTGLPDPCALVTRAEVEAATGGAVEEGEALEPGPDHYAFGLGRQCIFIPPPDGVVSPTFVMVYTYTADGWDLYKETNASMSHEVPGVGDEAFSAALGQIGVHQGDVVMEIQLGYKTSDPLTDDQLADFANIALGRL